MKAALKFAEKLKPAEVPFNASRRSMGLTLPKSESVADIVASQTSNPTTVEAQLKSITPLQAASDAISNMPMSRRQVIQAPVQAAVAHAGRKVLNAIDPVKPIVAPAGLTKEAAHEHAANYLSDALNRSLKRGEEGLHDEDVLEGIAARISLKNLAKKSGLPEDQLAQHITNDDLKNAFHDVAQEHNDFAEGNNDLWFPADEHVEKAFENLGRAPTTKDIHDLNVEAYESAKAASIDAALNPFRGYSEPHSELANKTFLQHSGPMVENGINDLGEDVFMDQVNELVNDRMKQ
jgi:hypothetical protein